MPTPRLTDEKRVEILRNAPYYKTKTALAEALGLNALNTLNSRIDLFGIGEEVAQLLGTRSDEEPVVQHQGAVEQTVKRESTDRTETLDAKGYRIKTVEQLLDEVEVDRTVWKVDKQVVNKYETFSNEYGLQEMFQVKAWLKRHEEAANLLALRDTVIDAMKAHAPAPVRRYKATHESHLAFDVLIPDLHLGKLAHIEETGSNYDSKIAVAAYRHVLYELLAHAQDMKVSRILFPLGNDLLHVDSAENATTAGTRQDTDTRYNKSRRRAIDLMVEAIEAMVQIAPTDVIVVPGNHARMQEEMLGEVIRGWFHREPRMTLHDSPAPRKYIRHGKTLLGFTHGDGIKAADLPLLMATEERKAWGESEFCFWNTGHMHQRRSNNFGATYEYKGVEVRISPSLTAPDSWHTTKGFIGNLRAAESHVYSETEGEVARFRATLPREEEE